MSYTVEVFCVGPADSRFEELLSTEALRLGGRLDFRESSGINCEGICLTFEFSDSESAGNAAERFRELGQHVEGPAEYG